MSTSRLSVVSESDNGEAERAERKVREEIEKKDKEYSEKLRRMSMDISKAREVLNQLNDDLAE